MTVGYREPLDAVTYWSVATSVPLDTHVGPYLLLSVETGGSLKYESTQGSTRTIRRILPGTVQLGFRKIIAGGTSAGGFSGNNPIVFGRILSEFDPFNLFDWPADREELLPALARQDRVLRDNFGHFHSDIVARDIFPDGWDSWPVVYVDPVNGKDNDSLHDGTTLAKAFRNLYKAITTSTVATCVVVPDGSKFGFGDASSATSLNLWPISQTNGQAPSKSFVIMPLSAFKDGEPSGSWTSSTELKVDWTTDTRNTFVVIKGEIQPYSPPISGADLSGWSANQSGAVFDHASNMLDEFGFGSRYKQVSVSSLGQNFYEYAIVDANTIEIRLPLLDSVSNEVREKYAKDNITVFANWIQGRIHNSADSKSCYISGRFLGGTPFRTFGLASEVSCYVAAYRSVFAYSAHSTNGFRIEGSNAPSQCVLIQCTAAQNGGDGFLLEKKYRIS